MLTKASEDGEAKAKCPLETSKPLPLLLVGACLALAVEVSAVGLAAHTSAGITKRRKLA